MKNASECVSHMRWYPRRILDRRKSKIDRLIRHKEHTHDTHAHRNYDQITRAQRKCRRQWWRGGLPFIFIRAIRDIHKFATNSQVKSETEKTKKIVFRHEIPYASHVKYNNKLCGMFLNVALPSSSYITIQNAFAHGFNRITIVATHTNRPGLGGRNLWMSQIMIKFMRPNPHHTIGHAKRMRWDYYFLVLDSISAICNKISRKRIYFICRMKYVSKCCLIAFFVSVCDALTVSLLTSMQPIWKKNNKVE